MRNSTDTMKSQVIQTTLGDLITAISDAASESTSDEEEIYMVTQVVLQDLLEHRKD